MDEEPGEVAKWAIVAIIFLVMGWAAFSGVSKIGSWIQPGLVSSPRK